MHFLPLLSLATLTLAVPHLKTPNLLQLIPPMDNTGFNTFTANPNPNGTSSISFSIVDTTRGTSSACGPKPAAGFR